LLSQHKYYSIIFAYFSITKEIQPIAQIKRQKHTKILKIYFSITYTTYSKQ